MFPGFATSLLSTETEAPRLSSSSDCVNQHPSSSARPSVKVDSEEISTTVPVTTVSNSQSLEIMEAAIPAAPKRGSVFGGTNSTCPRCEKNVYFAEMIHGPGGSKYHKLCFRCFDCDKSLDSMNSCVTTDNVLLCKTCYSKKHGPVGFG